ncbi:hypothetical protein M441DRAFT_62142 [Trichoderma asperellum CBS 433.97]|uniref:Uncharacterized protein n=1 Tax=Trichoderma asperellum (strain ATCC 204424 / CBS 433.97 / NBRC 101777) TaxID=1042311 RepID=A0A2T3YUF0_TRIA4|nr:hypothetical protein M441DRAFT_62142 [Trichoderma asperellum CBS 433.97]PTB36126.1 hypothetical protein M441DRAFT_62142 [Trichoderma asperellum CBS 433.97]
MCKLSEYPCTTHSLYYKDANSILSQPVKGCYTWHKQGDGWFAQFAVHFFVPKTAKLPTEEIAALFGDTVVVYLRVNGSDPIDGNGTDAERNSIHKLYSLEPICLDL